MNLSALRLVLSMLAFAPARNAADLDFRWESAEAIVDATYDPHEQDVLVRIQWLESAFRRDVARCSVRGDRGRSLGSFQIQPIGRGDGARACGPQKEQAALALSYVHRSTEACPQNNGADTLAMYVSGSCRRGLREARHRWAD